MRAGILTLVACVLAAAPSALAQKNGEWPKIVEAAKAGKTSKSVRCLKDAR